MSVKLVHYVEILDELTITIKLWMALRARWEFVDLATVERLAQGVLHGGNVVLIARADVARRESRGTTKLQAKCVELRVCSGL